MSIRKSKRTKIIDMTPFIEAEIKGYAKEFLPTYSSTFFDSFEFKKEAIKTTSLAIIC